MTYTDDFVVKIDPINQMMTLIGFYCNTIFTTSDRTDPPSAILGRVAICNLLITYSRCLGFFVKIDLINQMMTPPLKTLEWTEPQSAIFSPRKTFCCSTHRC